MTAKSSNPLLEAMLRAPIPRNAHVLAAVSGGPDSMGLLHALVQARDTGGRLWGVRVAHVNHMLRGDDSNADEAFVRERARAYGLPIEVVRVDVHTHARRQKQSVETAARELRYDALQHIAAKRGDTVIATGHTLDDQLETVIMRLLRGAGVRGLGGIPYRRGDIVRPLLDVRKSVVLAELEAAGVPYRLDQSNHDQRYRRNAIRHQAIPPLLQLQPALPVIVGRNSALLREDADLIEAVGREAMARALVGDEEAAITLSRPILRALHPALLHTVLATALTRVTPSIEIDARMFEVLERLVRTGARSPITVGQGTYAECGDAVLRLFARVPIPTAPTSSFLAGPGEIETPFGTMCVLEHSLTGVPPAARAVLGSFHALAGPDTIQWPIEIRTRRPGDRLNPEHGTGSKKLQDVFVDLKIPQVARDHLAIVTDRGGVLWVPGIMRDRRLASEPDTTPHMHLIFQQNQNATEGEP